MVARPAHSVFRTLFERLGRRISEQTRELGAAGSMVEDTEVSDQTARNALALMLDEAINVLKALGLPDRPGFYQWDPHRRDWSFLSSTMTPAERWATVLEAPIGEGWRYASLPQVVRSVMPDDDAVRQAAEVIEQGTACLNAADQSGSGDLEAAVKLAVAWAEFQVVRTVPAADRRGPLKLYFPPEDPEILSAPLKEKTKGARNTKAPVKPESRSKRPGAGS